MSEQFTPFGCSTRRGPIGEDISGRPPLSQEQIRAKIADHHPVVETALAETFELDLAQEEQQVA